MTSRAGSVTELLARQKCVPCTGAITPLQGAKLVEIKRRLGGQWRVSAGKLLEKKFKFPDFRRALKFTNQVGKLAEREGHHPEIFLSYGAVKIELTTHAAGGLTENDFILAAKIDQVK